MNKIKQLLWVQPNLWFDGQDCDAVWTFILPVVPSCLVNLYFGSDGFSVWLLWAILFSLYRFIWERLNPAKEEELEVSEYDFGPTFFKSNTREHLFSALESAKTNRQLAAAQELDDEFEYWEFVISDIENLIDSYEE